jgi:hypothetical protein
MVHLSVILITLFLLVLLLIYLLLVIVLLGVTPSHLLRPEGLG